MKEKIYQSCVKSAMLYGSEAWSPRENEMELLKRTEKTMMRAISGVKLIVKRKSQELMSLLSLEDTLDGLARVSGVRWYEHVRRIDNGDVLRRALDFEVREGNGVGDRIGREKTREEHIDQFGLKRKMPLTQKKWRDAVYELSKNIR